MCHACKINEKRKRRRNVAIEAGIAHRCDGTDDEKRDYNDRI